MASSKKTTSLTSRDINGCKVANRIFGDDKTVIVARPGSRCSLFWFTVPEGFYALVTRHGAQMDYNGSDGKPTCVWPSGLHFGPPWLKVSHLVTKQSMVFNTPIKRCKTKDNVSVDIDTSIVFRVMGDKEREEDPYNVYKFIHFVTARGLQQQLMDAQSEAMRTLVRSIDHNEVFGLRNLSEKELKDLQSQITEFSKLSPIVPATTLEPRLIKGQGGSKDFDEEEVLITGDHDSVDELEAKFNTETGSTITDIMKKRLNLQFEEQGVQILDVIIKEISLPREIMSQMSEKTMVISRNAEQRMQQKSDMMTLLQKEELITLEQSLDEEKMESKKGGDLECLKESFELDYQKALGEDVLQKISNQRAIDVGLIEAESAATCRRIDDTTRLEAEKIKGESKLKSTVAKVDVEGDALFMGASSDLTCAQNQSSGEKARYNAEGISAKKNKRLHEYLTATKVIEAQNLLAENEKLVVTGTSGGRAANLMLKSNIALKDSNAHNIPESKRRSLLSEIALSKGQSDVRIHIGAEQYSRENKR